VCVLSRIIQRQAFQLGEPDNENTVYFELRPVTAGLGRAEPVPAGGVFFVILVLAGISYDGLLPTSPWVSLETLIPIPRTLTETWGLLALPLLFLAVYLGFGKLSQLLGRGTGSLGRFAAAYAYSLVPIAIATVSIALLLGLSHIARDG